MISRPLVIVLFAFGIGTRSPLAQPLNFLTYSLPEGLPQSQVYALLQDSRGYIWCGTQGGGLSRFDGARFKTFDTDDGLPSNFVNAIFEDNERRLWVGTQQGVAWWDGGMLRTTLPRVNPTPDPSPEWEGSHDIRRDVVSRPPSHSGEGSGVGLTRGSILAITQTPSHDIWLGTPRGILSLSPQDSVFREKKLAPALDAAQVLAFFPEKNGTWVCTDRGAWHISEHGAVSRLPSHLGEGSGVGLTRSEAMPGTSVSAMTRTSDGRLWAALPGAGLALVDEAAMRLTDLRQSPNLQNITSLCAAPDGSLWVGTQQGGCAVFSPQNPEPQWIGEAQGLPHPHVRSLLADRDGRIWVGTSGGGVARAMGRQFRHFTTANGLSGQRVYALHTDAGGRIWLSASLGGLQMLDSAGFHNITQDSGYLSGVKCKTIASDRRGRIWVGTESRGLVVLDTGGIQRVQGLPSERIQSLLLAPDGAMWVATADNGASEVRSEVDGGRQTADGGRRTADDGRDNRAAEVRSEGPFFSVKNYGRREGLSDLSLSTLRADGLGRVWFGAQSGRIGFWENGRVAAVFGPESGLPESPVRALAFDASGRLWVGTRGSGVYRQLSAEAAPGAARFGPLEAKLASQNTYLLTFDAAGHLWVGNERGVDEVVFSPQNPAPEVRHYGRSEGFFGMETCHDAVTLDRRGQLWFGTMNGLMQHLPTAASRRTTLPLLHFEHIKLFYQDISETPYAAWLRPDGGLRWGLELPHHENDLSFEFRAVDLDHPDDLRYRWRLAGGTGSGEWSPLSEQTSVNFANLAPGAYTFEAEATADGGSRFSEPLHAAFFIKKPFWMTWPFRLAALAALLAVTFFGVKSRIRHIRRTEQAKREQLEMQHHLLQLEQKALQLQMNPHFIFNALTSIQSLVAQQDTATARQQLSTFAQLMRSTLNNSRKPLITLQEEADTLRQYLTMEQFCQQNPFDFEISIAPDLDPDEVELPPMLLQPFVENAVVHGVSHLTRRGKIEVEFYPTPGPSPTGRGGQLLCCRIRDNGVGRERAARLRQERKPGHQSAALSITRERLEALRTGDWAVLETSDVLDEMGEIVGTEVVVRVRIDNTWDG